MKFAMIFVRTLVAAALVGAAASAAAAQDTLPPMNADYVLIASATGHVRASYITALGPRQGDEVKVWMVDVFTPPGGPPPGEPTWSAALQTYNCKSNTYSYTRAESFDAQNRSLRVYDNLSSEPQAISENRPAWAVLQVVCGRARPANAPVRGVAGAIADSQAKAAAEAGA